MDSATSAAILLRVATSPARLAMLRPSRATGMRIAIKTRAARTSASVNAVLLRFLGANFIVQAAAAEGDFEQSAVASGQAQQLRADFANGTIREKTNPWQVRVF